MPPDCSRQRHIAILLVVLLLIVGPTPSPNRTGAGQWHP